MQAIRIQERLESVQARRHASPARSSARRSPSSFSIAMPPRRDELTARKIVEAGDASARASVLVAFDTRAEVQLQQMIFGAASLTPAASCSTAAPSPCRAPRAAARCRDVARPASRVSSRLAFASVVC